MVPSSPGIQNQNFPHQPAQPASPARRASSCELLGIDAYAEDDLGYAPS